MYYPNPTELSFDLSEIERALKEVAAELNKAETVAVANNLTAQMKWLNDRHAEKLKLIRR